MSIEILFDCIKKELMYQYYSKKYLIIISIFILLIFLNGNIFINDMESGIKNYEKGKQMLSDSELADEFNSSLTQEFQIEDRDKGDDQKITGDAIKDDLIKKGIQKFYLPKFISSNFEYILLGFGPYIFYILGVSIVFYDYKNKTLKLKSNLKIINYTIGSKILILILYSIMAVIVISIFSIFGALIGKYIIFSKFDIAKYYIYTIKFDIPLFIQAFFSVLQIIIFSLIGLTISLITKNKSLSVILGPIYVAIIPIGKYDLRNMISTLAHEIFIFDGNFRLFKPHGNSISFSIAYIILFIVALLLINYKLNKKIEIN